MPDTETGPLALRTSAHCGRLPHCGLEIHGGFPQGIRMKPRGAVASPSPGTQFTYKSESPGFASYSNALRQILPSTNLHQCW